MNFVVPTGIGRPRARSHPACAGSTRLDEVMIFEADAEVIGSMVGASLPEALAWTERAAAALRAYLEQQDLAHYRIFYARDHELNDLDAHLSELTSDRDPAPSWDPAPPATAGGQAPALFRVERGGEGGASLQDGGFLHLPRYELVIARWFWVNAEAEYPIKQLWLYAAPDAEHFVRLRDELNRLRRRGAGATWQIVKGYSHRDRPRQPRGEIAADELVLQPALLGRIETDVLGFFTPQVQELYRSLNVAYRRGVLLHGPPGNGKTSIIRWIGGKLLSYPAMILRPDASFDSDDFEEVIRRWSRQAPAMLVIEDLDWLIAKLNVSTFLNCLDGIEATVTGGLLLIATTNHPEKLDPAINNRPGRFDVAIEVPNPEAPLRREFLQRKLAAAVEPKIVDQLVATCDGFSFAHLHEVLRLAGLMAIRDGRRQRSDDDLLRAARCVRDGRDEATMGFPQKPEVPFGLQHLRALRGHTSSGDASDET
jgi:hypothetical protein